MIRALASWSGFGSSIFLSKRPGNASFMHNQPSSQCMHLSRTLERYYLFYTCLWKEKVKKIKEKKKLTKQKKVTQMKRKHQLTSDLRIPRSDALPQRLNREQGPSQSSYVTRILLQSAVSEVWGSIPHGDSELFPFCFSLSHANLPFFLSIKF